MPARLTLTITHLYPDLMNVYGDRGNILSLVRRAAWRGIDVHVEAASLGDRTDPGATDLYFFGGGQDLEQEVVAPDLVERKADALREAADAVVFLLVCGGYQLLGKYFRTHTGAEIPGIGVLDAWTVAGDRRMIGNTVVRCDWDPLRRTLVGFENHSGKTYLGAGCAPLGTALIGGGNNGEDGQEGAVSRNVFGCYQHGSLLPKNPWFTDELLLRGLRRRHGDEVELAPLDDTFETRAYAAAERRAQERKRVRSGAW